jgi:hypothetical protein
MRVLEAPRRLREANMKLLSRMSMSFAALILMGSTLAFAQTALPGGVPPAPTGHRQPNASEVPADDAAPGGGAGGSGAASTFGPELKLLPKLDIKATCRRAQPLGSGEKSAYQSCLDDEVQAQKELSHKWSSFKASARTTCSQETRIGGAPSFVELLTCLELDKQAAQARIENSKPLSSPTTPQPPAKGRAKGAKGAKGA